MSGANGGGGGELPPLNQTPGQGAPSGSGTPSTPPGPGSSPTPKPQPSTLRYVPSNPPGPSAPKTPDTEITQPDARPGVRPSPASNDYLPDVIGGRPTSEGVNRRRQIVVTTIVTLIAVVLAAIFLPWRDLFKDSPLPIIGGCASGSPCQVTDAYLSAYSGGDYEAMYALTSAASQKRFGAPEILGSNYKDAHDYIVNRTKSIVGAAKITKILVTAGDPKQNGQVVTVPAHVIMSSQRAGDITQDISIPLTQEKGHWLVEWSPGLIFSQLDDASDPNYTRVVRLIETTGKRGAIFDRDNNALAKDDTVYDIGVIRSKITNEGNLLNTLSGKLDLTTDQVKAKYQSAQPDDFALVRTVTPMLYAQVSAAVTGVAGVEVRQRVTRVYPYGFDTAAVTGYVQGVSADDLKKDTSGYYAANDLIGRAGLELWGEQKLRPVKGGKLVIRERNADGSDGRIVDTVASRDAADGADIRTPISLVEQQAAMTGLRASYPTTRGGGVMAVEPATGEVRVVASWPIYDPNDFVVGRTPHGDDEFKKLNAPYTNRAIQESQPVGSVFKVVTLSAGLEHGVKGSDIFTCTGTVKVDDTHTVKEDGTGHGNITAPAAIGPSCDIIPIQIALKLNQQDPNFLPSMAKAYGFGAPTGIIGFVNGEELGGIVPDPQYYKDKKNAGWTAVNAANLAIGQDDFQATPAQVAMAAAAVANGGLRMQPRLVTQVVSSDGAILANYEAKRIGSLPLSADNLSVLQIALLGPTNDPSGTAYLRFKDFPTMIAGKTGTAESGDGLHPHGWFLSYAPAITLSANSPKPEIAVGALAEYIPNFTFGECYAAPLVAQVYIAHFKIPGDPYAAHLGCSKGY